MKTEDDLLEEIGSKLPQEYKYLASNMLITVKENKEILFPPVKEPTAICSSKDAYTVLHKYIGTIQHEEFWVITLNRAHKIIHTLKISQGGLTGTIIDTRLIIRNCLEDKATAFIISHNHPSGNKRPSEADINITKKIKDAGKLMELTLLDHVIITPQTYFSFADEGLML